MTKNWTSKSEATSKDVEKLQATFANKVPRKYIDFLKQNNGGVGDYPDFPTWLDIYSIEQIIEINALYQIQTEKPGYLAIGTNRGGEFVMILLNGYDDSPVYAVNSISMHVEEDNWLMTNSIEPFLDKLGEPNIADEEDNIAQ